MNSSAAGPMNARHALTMIIAATECPEIGGAGFLVPGQTKSTDPLDRLVICGFYDHHHEGDARFSGRVSIEAR